MKPVVVAHRGLHQEHCENSVEAFCAAWEAGFEWCECDVRGSREHEPFVVHDETVDRTTCGIGRVDELSSDTLRELGVPSLRGVFERMDGSRKLLIEIKPGVHPEAVRRTLEMCDPRNCIVQSFDPGILLHAAKLRSDVRLELLVEDAAQRGDGGPWRAVNAHFQSLNGETVARLKAGGFAVGAWTVNGETDIRRMIELGIDTLITDDPRLARDTRAKIG
jgi:glycerophosphoryl diester phosphodiesterase